MLLGMMQLANLVFPESVQFSSADVVARAPFWEVGLDYAGEIGHEVGTFAKSQECKSMDLFKKKWLMMCLILVREFWKPKGNLPLKPGYFLINSKSLKRKTVRTNDP